MTFIPKAVLEENELRAFRRQHGSNPQKPPEPVRYDRVGVLNETRQQRRAAERAEVKKAKGLAWANQYVNNLYKVHAMKKAIKENKEVLAKIAE